MPKVRFAVFFVVAVLGAVLLLISQIPLTKSGYDVIEIRSFSVGERLTFYSTFEANVEYRLVVKGVDWTSTRRYVHDLSVSNDTYLWGMGGLMLPPWAWSYNQPETSTLNVTFWHYDENGSQQIERATTLTSVEISQLGWTTYRLTSLIYVGLPLLIISAILITITGKDLDSRMRMPDTSAR